MRAKKTGLGRGLGALITEIDEESNNGDFRHISIELIKPNPKQPRMDFNEVSLSELTDSIKVNGVLQPILVIELENHHFQIVAGERRWRAAKLAGLTEIPCRLLNDFTKESLGTISLIENLQREDLNPIEFAKGCQSLIKENEWTQEVLAEKLGKSRVAITNSIRLLNLPEAIQESIRRGEISEGHGRLLLQVANELQENLWRKVIELKLSVRELENQLQQSKSTKKKSKKFDQTTFDDPILRNRIEDKLGCRVSFDGSSTKGKLILHFQNEIERNEIIEKIIGNR